MDNFPFFSNSSLTNVKNSWTKLSKRINDYLFFQQPHKNNIDSWRKLANTSQYGYSVKVGSKFRKIKITYMMTDMIFNVADRCVRKQAKMNFTRYIIQNSDLSTRTSIADNILQFSNFYL